MIVKRLTSTGYRNCEDFVFEPSSGINVLYGNNAQGKTNILEAIWLFTGSRSFRGTKDSDLVCFNKNFCRLKMDFLSYGRKNSAVIKISDTRKAQINGVDLESPVKLAGEFCSVIFSPEHLGIVKGVPQIRRKFIDSAICQLWPRLLSVLANYNKALAHRNALLKDIPRHSELLDTVDVWNEKIASAGAQIIYARLRYLDRLNSLTKNIYSGISSGEEIDLLYKNSEQKTYKYDSQLSQSDAVTGLKQNILKNLELHLKRDIESGFTHDGPHRDDIDILINKISARLYASQGQQRSAALAVKLAEASVLLSKTGEPPVLLLDDVMSELDSSRQNYILNNVCGWQVFITCCDPSVIGSLEKGTGFHIQEGRIIAQEN